MFVFNPGQVPVVVDDGFVVAAAEHADIADPGPLTRSALDRHVLLEVEQPAPAPDVEQLAAAVDEAQAALDAATTAPARRAATTRLEAAQAELAAATHQEG